MGRTNEKEQITMTDRTPAGNSTFAIGGVSFSADSFMVKESAVLRMNFGGAEKPSHYKSTKRFKPF